jgi:hypothetical protein
MLIGTLTPDFIRTTYLRGVSLGPAWEGPSADGALMTLLLAAIEEAQGKLGVQFARQRVRTYPDPGTTLGVDYEIQGEPLTYFPPADMAAHVVLPLPFAHVQSIERVRIFFGHPGLEAAGKERYTIPPAWILFTQKEGVLKILPTGTWPLLPVGSLAGYDVAYDLGRRRVDLVGAWAVDYTIGYGQVPADVAHWIGLTVAMQVLAQAGAGGTSGHGVSSESLSMDGISESTSYVQGTYGPYSGLIATYKEARECLDPWQLRARYKGFKIATW